MSKMTTILINFNLLIILCLILVETKSIIRRQALNENGKTSIDMSTKSSDINPSSDVLSTLSDYLSTKSNSEGKTNVLKSTLKSKPVPKVNNRYKLLQGITSTKKTSEVTKMQRTTTTTTKKPYIRIKQKTIPELSIIMIVLEIVIIVFLVIFWAVTAYCYQEEEEETQSNKTTPDINTDPVDTQASVRTVSSESDMKRTKPIVPLKKESSGKSSVKVSTQPTAKPSDKPKTEIKPKVGPNTNKPKVDGSDKSKNVSNIKPSASSATPSTTPSTSSIDSLKAKNLPSDSSASFETGSVKEENQFNMNEKPVPIIKTEPFKLKSKDSANQKQ